MRTLSEVVTADPALAKLAESAFRSYIRAYAVHQASVR